MTCSLNYSESLLLKAGMIKIFNKSFDILHILRECDELIESQVSIIDSL